MKYFHILVAMTLALLSFLVGIFWMGTPEEHQQQVQQYFWGTLGLRFLAGLLVGLGGWGGWWLLNLALAKVGLVQRPRLSQKMVRLVAGPALGALAGALLFCLA